MMKKLMERVRMIRENQKKNGTKGFSMIELIIVIAIMAILVALIGTQLIPYLEKSRLSKDTSNLDSALTSFQTALIETEKAAVNGNWTFGSLDTDVEAAFTKYAGFASGDLKGMLKSKEATAATSITVTSDANGALTLTCGTIVITPKGTGGSSSSSSGTGNGS